MIARGIVEKIHSPSKVAVRVPSFDKSKTAFNRTLTDDLGVATICTLPNFIPNVRVGDCVFVGFEHNDISSPVILGYLYTEESTETKQDAFVESINVNSNAKLPMDTTIGDVTANEIQQLHGINTNIQRCLTYILDEIEHIKEQLNS